MLIMIVVDHIKCSHMSKKITLSIPTPCHESWHLMTTVEKGRFCQSCNKVVTDFTDMSDQAIIACIQEQKGNVCGRLHRTQLMRELSAPVKPRTGWLRFFFQFTLPAFFIAIKPEAKAQTMHKPATETVAQNVQRISTYSSDSIPAPWSISGIITDKKGGVLPGATIMLKNTKEGTVSNTEGLFTIKVPRNMQAASLVISYVGFETMERKIKKGEQENQVFNLQLSESVMGEVILAGVIITTPVKKKANYWEKLKDSINVGKAKLYPNPVVNGNSFTLETKVKENGTYSLQVFTAAGLPVRTQRLVVNEKRLVVNVATDNLLPGNYYISVQSPANNNVCSKAFIVQ